MPKKKVKKYRGSKTCGGGSKKKRRGGGSRGGRGNAGVHKHKYIKFVKLAKEGLYEFGKHGFNRPKVVRAEYKALRGLKLRLKELKEEGVIDDELYRFFDAREEINVGDLDLIIDKLVEVGLAKKEGDQYFLDLGEIGYEKLLGSGKITKAVKVVVSYATPKAVEKIEAAGGEVVSS